MKPRIFAVCGAIGAGKTTTLNELPKHLPFVKSIPENVEAFSTFGCYNPLELLYKDPKRYGFSVQLHIISEMEKLYKSFDAVSDDVVVTDCFPFAHYWFINALEQKGYIDDFQKLLLNQRVQNLEEYVSSKFDLAGIFYLQNKNFLSQLLSRQRDCEMLHPDIRKYAKIINSCLHDFIMDHARKYTTNVLLFHSGTVEQNTVGLRHFISKTLHGMTPACQENEKLWKRRRTS